MTVRRIGRQIYDLDQATLVEHTRQVLLRGRSYKGVYEHGRDSEALFTTSVESDVPLVLSTEFVVAIKRVNVGTAVEVSTRSQRWIMGDVFGMYDRYIRQFFTELKTSVGGNVISETSPGNPEAKGLDINWFALAYMAFVMLVIVVYLAVFARLDLSAGLSGLSPIEWFFIGLLVLLMLLIIWNVARVLRRT